MTSTNGPREGPVDAICEVVDDVDHVIELDRPLGSEVGELTRHDTATDPVSGRPNRFVGTATSTMALRPRASCARQLIILVNLADNSGTTLQRYLPSRLKRQSPVTVTLTSV